MLDDQPTSDPAEADTSLEATDAAPIEGHAATDQPEVDYAKRYNDLRPEFDRTKQELAEHRRLVEALSADDPDTRREAAEALGLQLIDDEPEPDFEDLDPLNELRRELDELKGWKTSREEAEAQAARNDAVLNHVNSQITDIEKDLGEDFEFDAEELEVIVSLARALETEDGLPDVQAAWNKLNGVTQKSTQRWAKSKPKSAVTSPAGKSATKQPDLNNRSERLDHMLERVQSLDL